MSQIDEVLREQETALPGRILTRMRLAVAAMIVRKECRQVPIQTGATLPMSTAKGTIQVDSISSIEHIRKYHGARGSREKNEET